METVAVLVSTYNGGKYLREQLDSILNQKGVGIEIFVRDDGSSDDTRKILDEYAVKHVNFHADYSDNVGVGNSFMKLVYTVPSGFDYYSLADQDDIWEEDKIFQAVKLIKESSALLYASNQECVDKDGVPLGLRYGKDCSVHLTPVSILEENMLAGCTMVFTAAFCSLLKEENKRPSETLLKNRIHDVWIAMVASLYKGIVFDSRSFIHYRQHENNVVGAYSGGLRKRLKQKLKKLKHREFRNGRSMLAVEVSEKFPETVKEYPLVEICADAKSLKGKFRILRNSKELRLYTGENSFGFMLKVLFGWF